MKEMGGITDQGSDVEQQALLGEPSVQPTAEPSHMKKMFMVVAGVSAALMAVAMLPNVAKRTKTLLAKTWDNEDECWRIADDRRKNDCYEQVLKKMPSREKRDNDYYDESCFPADAIVQIFENDTVKAINMKDIYIGAMVKTSSGFSPVYVMGHQDHDAVTNMITFRTATNHMVSASPGHYINLTNGESKSVQNLMLGDIVKVTNFGDLGMGIDMNEAAIVDISVTEQKGLFNPYTISGDIIVNGVVMDDDSEWFLEGYLSEDTIPKVYRMVTSPLRAMYHVKPAWFNRFNEKISNHPGYLGSVGTLGIIKAAATTFSAAEL